MNEDNKVILEKVRKLLALATSSNEHEATVAAAKAQELLTKYNLTEQKIGISHEYEKMELENDMPYLSLHHKYVCGIINKYFFVLCVSGVDEKVKVERTIDGRRKFRYSVEIAGTPSNVEFAAYVYSFLCTMFTTQWLKYKRENGLTEKHRESYFIGLYRGVGDKLEQARVKVETEMGLVVVKDNNIEKMYDN